MTTNTGGWILAIDFGTTNTSAAIADGDRVDVVEIDGAARMPSVVLASESGDLVVGSAAERQVALSPERAERTPKRRIGDEVMLLGSRPVRPVDAVGAIFGAVAAEARRRQGGVAPRELRLTHPARWGAVRLNVLAEAAELAGLPTPWFIPEPVAAAVHFADERIVDGAYVAVYDLGGGTFDTAVLRRTGAGFDVVGPPGGDERLGGETFDDRLWEHLGARLAADKPEAWEALRFGSERQWRKAGFDFRLDVRRAKEALSANADYTLYEGAPVDAELLVTRDELESLIRVDVEATVTELLATIDRAGLSSADLAAVNLVGGSSRIPLVTRMVADRLGRVPDTWGDPKAAVVLGAAKARQSEIRSSDSGRRRTRSTTPSHPARIGAYEILGELGRGGMGVVYLARQSSLGRLVAVKTLPTLDPSLTARLEREAAVLAELQHPHIATVLDVGIEEAATYVVMPFFPGGTVAQVVDHDGQLPPAQVSGVLAAVAEALAATHARGFLHRDVKPSNILLSAEGEPYLADFGLAFPMLDSSRLTSSRAVLGTVPYTAPEIIADEPPQPASDLYALGISGYQLLAGRLPYGGSNVLAVIDHVRQGTATPLAEIVPDIPPALASLIAEAMAPDATRRPSDLRAWAAAVRAAAPPEPVQPVPPARWADLAAAPMAAPPVDEDVTVPSAATAAAVAAAAVVTSPIGEPKRSSSTDVGDGTDGADEGAVPPVAVPLAAPAMGRRSTRARTPRNGPPKRLVVGAIAVAAMLLVGVVAANALAGDDKPTKLRAAAASVTNTTTTTAAPADAAPSTTAAPADPVAAPETTAPPPPKASGAAPKSAGTGVSSSGGAATSSNTAPPAPTTTAAPAPTTTITESSPSTEPRVVPTTAPPTTKPNQAPYHNTAYPTSSTYNLSGHHGWWDIWLKDDAFIDPEGDLWKVSSPSNGQWGSTTISSCAQNESVHGCLRYQPYQDYGYCYEDTISYSATDPTGSNKDASTRITLTVTAYQGYYC